MNNQTKYIKLVSKLLENTEIKTPPVKLEKITDFLNLEVRGRRYSGKGEISGVLIRNLDKNIIGVNADHHEHRQRFTIAHEIAHFLLHEGEQVFVDKEIKVNLRDSNAKHGTALPEEAEANLFAGMLLIPEEFLLKDLKKYNLDLSESAGVNNLVQELATKYNVSQAAMLLRLVNRAP